MVYNNYISFLLQLLGFPEVNNYMKFFGVFCLFLF